jgi:hypothetical protein
VLLLVSSAAGGVVDSAMGSVVDNVVGSVVENTVGGDVDITMGGIVMGSVVEIAMGSVVDNGVNSVYNTTHGVNARMVGLLPLEVVSSRGVVVVCAASSVMGSVDDVGGRLLLPQFETQIKFFQTLVQVGSSRQVTLDAALRVLLLALGPLSRGRVRRRWALPPRRWAGATMARRGQAVVE